MTKFNEFTNYLGTFVATYPNYRLGQNAFLALQRADPGLADEVRGGDWDPFHHDDRVPALLAYLATRWRDDADAE